MKTRYIFEPKDFNGSGQLLIRQSADSPKSQPGFKSSVYLKVGYIHDASRELQVTTLIWMNDGMIRIFDSRQALCTYLNEDEEGYRPARPDELADLATQIGNRFT